MHRLTSRTFLIVGGVRLLIMTLPALCKSRCSNDETNGVVSSVDYRRSTNSTGLGRSIHSILTDPEGNDAIDTTYDGVMVTHRNGIQPHRTTKSFTDAYKQT